MPQATTASRIKAAFALSLVGHAIAGASVAMWGPPGGAGLWGPPPWVFAAVWIGLYPCVAVATLLAVRGEGMEHSRRARLVGGVAIALTLLWMPLACASAAPAAPAILDAVTLIAWLLGAAVYRASDTRALRWLTPVLCWLPVTLAISTVAWIDARATM